MYSPHVSVHFPRGYSNVCYEAFRILQDSLLDSLRFSAVVELDDWQEASLRIQILPRLLPSPLSQSTVD